MIKLKLYNDSDVIVNADLIESVEKTPDTIISLTTGKKVMVKESVEDVINRVVAYRRMISKSNRHFNSKNRHFAKPQEKEVDRWT
jgi:flagellar protein FlbD